MDTPQVPFSQAFVPVMERSRFAELVGVDVGVVTGWIDKGHLPTIKIGKYRLVNIALLVKECLEEEWQK